MSDHRLLSSHRQPALAGSIQRCRVRASAGRPPADDACVSRTLLAGSGRASGAGSARSLTRPRLTTALSLTRAPIGRTRCSRRGVMVASGDCCASLHRSASRSAPISLTARIGAPGILRLCDRWCRLAPCASSNIPGTRRSGLGEWRRDPFGHARLVSRPLDSNLPGRCVSQFPLREHGA